MTGRAEKDDFPVAIGGVGGSGTRVFALALRELGFFTGPDINRSEDNLLFSLLFRRPKLFNAAETEIYLLAKLFRKAMSGAPCEVSDDLRRDLIAGSGFGADWVKERLKCLESGFDRDLHPARWGWKEPNTHIFVEPLLREFNSLRYIHVIRDGRDMAFSKNQNQVVLWGEAMLGKSVSKDPRDSIDYWCEVHRRLSALRLIHPQRIMFVSFEELCMQPKSVLGAIAKFCAADLDRDCENRLLKQISPPESIGRWKKTQTTQFSTADHLYVDSVLASARVNGRV